ncbi:MAG: type II toxin-antitoxin system HipA family toxin YjjJ [Idiomarina sp.]|nr:type II toxin-antitoxin system HipA family toxin YjjJ [Idiomarina sp.]
MATITDNILLTLRSGPRSAADIATRLGVDASTVSRQLNAINDQVIKAGSGRGTRWYLSRPLEHLDEARNLPIYRVSAHGRAERIANLYSVYPADTYLVEYFRPTNSDAPPNMSREWTCYESLPWWLNDMRPQGFLGRLLAKKVRSSGEQLDADPRRWRDDHVLAILLKYPQDHVGNLLIGDVAYEAWLQRREPQPISDLAAAKIADAIAAGEHFESSAQGEQPKFTARLTEGDCIVKFSGVVEQTQEDGVPNRWADLLHTEALASVALNAALPGIAALNRSFNENGRTLLASLRFDRTTQGGRNGLVSFTSLDAEFVGKANRPWPVIVDALHQERVVTEKTVMWCKVAWAFGQLIANSDMHLGNVSVIHRGAQPYELAPIYDMLPMHYAPTAAGDLPSELYQIRVIPEVPRVCWEMAFSAAIQFWELVLIHTDISLHFKVLAERQLQHVRGFEQALARMA